MAHRSKLTVRLPAENIAFVKRFAAEHGLTVTEVLNRYLTNLRDDDRRSPIHPEVVRFSGLVPAEVDAGALYRDHLLDKHG